MPDNSDIEEIIRRNLVNSITEAERRKLNRWRQLSANNEESFRLMEKVWTAKSYEPIHQNQQTMERRIIEAGFKKNPEVVDIPGKVLLLRTAAVITLICVSIWVGLKLIPGDEVIPQTEELVVTYNPSGQKSKITLPDNSEIWLNSDSKLSYQKGFTDSVRYLQLEGEAYFEVEPDLSRPFIVETGNIVTTVTGTSFNIRNFPEENSISVALLSGKVKVNDNLVANELFLEPYEQVEFTKNTRNLKMIRLDEDAVSIWKDGIIFFKKSSFHHVIRTLERSYDVTIDTSGYSKNDWSYTGSFNSMSLEIVLTRIGYSEGFDFEIDGNNIRIMNE